MSHAILKSYKGHTYISVGGDAFTPARFWKVQLLTLEEYKNLPEKYKKDFIPLKNCTSAKFHIKLHNL